MLGNEGFIVFEILDSSLHGHLNIFGDFIFNTVNILYINEINLVFLANIQCEQHKYFENIIYMHRMSFDDFEPSI